jgi:hypothetical protein
MRKADPDLLTIWRFLRGETQPKDFEAWICSNLYLEERIGAALYLDVISADYRDYDAVDKIKQDLSAWAQPLSPSCRCITLRDLDVVDMSHENLVVFETLSERLDRGDPYWWLSTSCCSVCGDHWLIGEESRQNDIYCMRRLSETEAASIRKDGAWPSDFDTYERLLVFGHAAGRSVRFVDPMNSSLRWTIQDLARNRPGIRVSELANLLNLDLELATTLARAAVSEEQVTIEFDG